MTAYYNEFDPKTAQWLRNLIEAGLIAPGHVDDRSILDVTPGDLKGFTQCHFFAGIGGWSLALRRAGWPDRRPVWSGSPPCQPFSAAGRRGGFDDERHLWPHFARLIRECGPTEVIGEQVASKAVEPWLDLVQTDLEAMDYAFGCVAFPSASVGAPHIRDRSYWVAHRNDARLEGWAGVRQRPDQCIAWSDGLAGGMADASNIGDQRKAGAADHARKEAERPAGGSGRCGSAFSDEPGLTGPTHGPWRDADWIFCRDRKWRPVEPGTFPLANGVPARVVRLRAYGNAINIEQATTFIEAYLDTQRSAGSDLDDLI